MKNEEKEVIEMVEMEMEISEIKITIEAILKDDEISLKEKQIIMEKMTENVAPIHLMGIKGLLVGRR